MSLNWNLTELFIQIVQNLQMTLFHYRQWDLDL